MHAVAGDDEIKTQRLVEHLRKKYWFYMFINKQFSYSIIFNLIKVFELIYSLEFLSLLNISLNADLFYII